MELYLLPPSSSPIAAAVASAVVASGAVASGAVASGAVASPVVASPPMATPPEAEVASQDGARVLSADMSIASTQSMLSADSDGGDFDSATFFNQVKR